jgi:hypothetical protein
VTIWYDVKGPSAVLDYLGDWTPFLVPGDTITASIWTPTLPGGELDNGITVQSMSFASTNTTVWLAGGAVGDPTHMIVNHITTAQGRQDSQILYIDIFQK